MSSKSKDDKHPDPWVRSLEDRSKFENIVATTPGMPSHQETLKDMNHYITNVYPQQFLNKAVKK